MIKIDKDTDWLKLINECRASGLTDHQWCVDNGIKPSTFYYHVNSLQRKACKLQAPAAMEPRPQQEVVQLNLVDNNKMQSTRYVDDTAVRININGFRVSISNNATQAAIENTIRALRSSC